MKVGERIRKRRIELGLTQDQLAKRLGYKGRSAVCHMESEDNSLTPKRVEKIADALYTSAAWLYGWTDDQPPAEAFIEPTVSEEEMKIIEAFRAKSYAEKLAFKTLLGIQEDGDHDD